MANKNGHKFGFTTRQLHAGQQPDPATRLASRSRGSAGTVGVWN